MKNFEKDFPICTDNKHQYNEIPRQKAGFCHIYSAIALVEAACFRATGKMIDISEAYMINRHLSTKLAKMSSIDLDQPLLASIQRGKPIDTVSRIMNCSVCTEQELPIDHQFIRDLNLIVDELKSEYLDAPFGQLDEQRQELVPNFDLPIRELDNQLEEYVKARALLDEPSEGNVFDRLRRVVTNPFEKKRLDDLIQESKWELQNLKRLLDIEILKLDVARSGVKKKFSKEVGLHGCQQLGGQIRCHFDNAEESRYGGLAATTDDPDLKACLEEHNFSVMMIDDFSNSIALDLLTHNIPFLCVTHDIVYYEGYVPSGHGVVIAGYEWSSVDEKINYIIRDSNLPDFSSGWDISCDYIIVIKED